MPKHEPGSAKAIANRQKLVGLQKLRWYCQMCQKQCRDENGFKCHTMSEGHLQQMRLFSQSSGSILDQFSSEFESGFMRTLSHLHGTKRVLVNRVYQEYIQDKHHIHMNATSWTTLTGFCKYLGKEGKAIVDETEKGWYIQYIERDPVLLAKQQNFDSRKREELEEDERGNRLMEMQIRLAQEEQAQQEENASSDAEPSADAEDDQPRAPVSIQWAKSIDDIGGKKKRPVDSLFQDEDDEEDAAAVAAREQQLLRESQLKRMKSYGCVADKVQSVHTTAAAVNAQSHSQSTTTTVTSTSNNGDNGNAGSSSNKGWLAVGIQVKVVQKRLKDLNGLKGEVLSLCEPQSCRLLIDGHTHVLAQEDLQTVVPRVHERGLMLRGPYKGRRVEVLAINKDKFNCDLRLLSDERDRNSQRDDRRELLAIDYEDFSKLA